MRYVHKRYCNISSGNITYGCYTSNACTGAMYIVALFSQRDTATVTAAAAIAITLPALVHAQQRST
jgi:hypothetical protein